MEEIKKIKQWFKNKPLFQKVLIIFAGVCFLFAIYIVSVLVRYNSSPIIPVTEKTDIQGKVSDQNGKPIDGAVVANAKNAVVTTPDGKFEIQAKTTDTLTVSAFGYQTMNVYSPSQPLVTLPALASGTVRLDVVGPQNQKLNRALVYRLNANTLEAVTVALTNQSGEAVFKNIPSGQAVFVVLHPDYGFGWLETSLDPGGVKRAVVRLEEISQEKKKAKGFIPVAFAQESSNNNTEQLTFRLGEITNAGDGKYQINMIGESRTFVSVNFNRKEIKQYIDRVSQLDTAQQFDLNDEVARTVNKLVGQENQLSPIRTVRITQGPSDTNYAIEYGLVSGIVVKTVKKTYEVEIEKPSSIDSMVYMQQQYATVGQDDQVVTVTNWSQAQAGDLQDVEQVAFIPANTAVCCNQTNTNAASGETGLPSEVSSNSAPPSNLTLINSNSRPEYLYYSHKAVNEMTGGPNLTIIANGILEQNPTLTFTDKSGNTFSFLDISAPNPNDAPPAFLLDFFDNTSDARSTYLNNSISYKVKWKQFMAAIGSDVFRKEGRVPAQVYRDLLQDTGSSLKWRLEEEQRLARQSQSGSQGSGQQSQSAPANASIQDDNQQSQQTESSDFQDDITQAPIISGSPDSEQNDTGQEDSSTTQKSSGNKSKNSNSGGTYYGPGAVGSR